MRAQGPAPAARASVADRGTVTGRAAVCDGPMLLGPPRASVVYALRGGKRAGRAQVTGGRYQLMLRPGRYLIGAPASADPPELVTVRPRGSVVVDFPDPCR